MRSCHLASDAAASFPGKSIVFRYLLLPATSGTQHSLSDNTKWCDFAPYFTCRSVNSLPHAKNPHSNRPQACWGRGGYLKKIWICDGNEYHNSSRHVKTCRWSTLSRCSLIMVTVQNYPPHSVRSPVGWLHNDLGAMLDCPRNVLLRPHVNKPCKERLGGYVVY